MPDEYFFQGTIPQYWRVVYTEYLRLCKSLEREPFEFTEPQPNRQPLAEYVPMENSVILISFWNAEHIYKISVDAEFSPDREMVQVMAFYQGAFTKEGESALAMWREVKHALAKNGRLLDMTKSVKKAKKLSPKKPHPHQRIVDVLARLRENRLIALENNRPIPKKKIAIKDAGNISAYTWKRYDPELWKRWYDENYRQAK